MDTLTPVIVGSTVRVDTQLCFWLDKQPTERSTGGRADRIERLLGAFEEAPPMAPADVCGLQELAVRISSAARPVRVELSASGTNKLRQLRASLPEHLRPKSLSLLLAWMLEKIRNDQVPKLF